MSMLIRRKAPTRLPARLLLCLVALGISGCLKRVPAFVQGDWFFSAPGVAGITSQTSVYTYWSFDHGKVAARSCDADFPGMHGDYRVVESHEDSLVLELYNIDGVGVGTEMSVRILIDREADALSIQGVGPFSRLP